MNLEKAVDHTTSELAGVFFSLVELQVVSPHPVSRKSYASCRGCHLQFQGVAPPFVFPWFNPQRYWQDRILELRKQIALMQEPPLWQA